MKYPKTPKTKAVCWNCGQVNPTHVLPGVRIIICPNTACAVIHPSESQQEYAARSAEFGVQARAL